MSSPVSHGFRHLRHPSLDEEGRVPPGQYVTEGFPVLSAGPTPHSANARHSRRTWHRAQIAFASTTWAMDWPDDEIGKIRSGSADCQPASAPAETIGIVTYS
jgi:hypothetical protein